MDIFFEKKDIIKQWIYRTSLFLLLVLGMAINFSNSSYPYVKNLISRFYQSYLNSLLIMIIAYICVRLSVTKKYTFKNKIVYFLVAIFSLFYSLSFILGRSIASDDTLGSIWSSGVDYILFLWSLLAWTFILYQLCIRLVGWLTIISYTASGQTRMHSFGTRLAIIMLCWSPWAIINFPGVLNYDGAQQISEFFGYSVQGSLYFTLTNHHPVFTTLLESVSIKIGKTFFDSFNIGLFIYVVIVMISIACSIVVSCRIIEQIVGKRLADYLFYFDLLFPPFFMWSVTVDKTGLFLAAVNFFVSFLIKIINYKSVSFQDYLSLLVSGVFVCIIRNDALLYVLMATFGAIFSSIKIRKKLLMTLGSSLVLGILLSKILTISLNAIPTEPAEDLGIPIQQIARVVKYNRDSISQKERHVLDNYFYVNKMAKWYNPSFFDPIKVETVKWPYYKFRGNYRERLAKYNAQPIVKDKRKLFDVWLSIGLKNPKLYIEAFVSQTVNYYCPFIDNHGKIFDWDAGTSRGFDKLHQNVYKQYLPYFPRVQMYSGKIVNAFGNVIPFNIIFSCFTWSFLALMLSIVLINKYRWKYLSLIFITLAVVFIPFIGPVNGTFKYFLPLTIVVPIMVVISLGKSKFVQNIDELNKGDN
jgi:hypothetical protein